MHSPSAAAAQRPGLHTTRGAVALRRAAPAAVRIRVVTCSAAHGKTTHGTRKSTPAPAPAPDAMTERDVEEAAETVVKGLESGGDAEAAVAMLARLGETSGASLQLAHARLSFQLARTGLDKVVDEWNAGIFEGAALSGKLKADLSRPLSLAALSFGQFQHPTGLVRLDEVRILKGSSAPHAAAAPDFYAVRSCFSFVDPARGQPQRGMNTVLGRFELDENRTLLRVAFDRVQLALCTDGLTSAETRALPAPAPATLRLLLMTPNMTVTHSSTGSLAVLRRASADELPSPSIVCVQQPPPPAAEALASALARGVGREGADALYASCAPVERVEELLGTWRGEELPTGAPMDGALKAAGWYGKRFESAEAVHPLLFRSPSGPPAALEPRLVFGLPRILPFVPARLLSAALRPLLKTERPGARLRMAMDPAGALTAAMLYDSLPVIDYFRRVDADTLLGVMDARGVAEPFFFVLRRD